MKPIPAEYAGLYRASEYLSENELGWSYSQSPVHVVPSVEEGRGACGTRGDVVRLAGDCLSQCGQRGYGGMNGFAPAS